MVRPNLLHNALFLFSETSPLLYASLLGTDTTGNDARMLGSCCRLLGMLAQAGLLFNNGMDELRGWESNTSGKCNDDHNRRDGVDARVRAMEREQTIEFIRLGFRS